MNNDTLVAASGVDAAGAVHGYRRHVSFEVKRHGLALGSEAHKSLKTGP